MKICSFLLNCLFLSSLVRSEFPYLFGTSLNTKGVSNGFGIDASETTAHALDDVAQSKSYGHGDSEINARSQAQTIWTNILHGANSSADSLQTGQGDTLADSWSKSFTPTREYYLHNYYAYIKFLNHLFARDMPESLKQAVKGRIEDSIANYQNPDFLFNGEVSFDLQQARSSGNKIASSTGTQNFNWGRNHTIHKGDSIGSAGDGWATSNNANWALGRNNYVTTNKNAAAFGQDSLTNGESNYYINKGQIYNTGKAWGQTHGQEGFTYSQLNGNSFGYSALNGGSNTYSNGNRAVSLSELRGTPYLPKVSRQAAVLCCE